MSPWNAARIALGLSAPSFPAGFGADVLARFGIGIAVPHSGQGMEVTVGAWSLLTQAPHSGQVIDDFTSGFL
jgi:hypothetical protein